MTVKKPKDFRGEVGQPDFPKNVVVIIPAFRVASKILGVVREIPNWVAEIIVVDDCCPENSGDLVEKSIKDPRVKVVRHMTNQGVGGAMRTGYIRALNNDSNQVFIKIDGDGQMDLNQIPALIAPILSGRADYTKGNRFDSIEDLEQMPRLRILGNAVLSLFSKISSGYWNVTDPTNGFTAIDRTVLERIKLEKVRSSFFFESDMLFRLSLARAVVEDVPMKARYLDEKSNLKIRKVLREFPARYFINHLKRIFYQYYLREWSVASFELPLGLVLFSFGWIYGLSTWMGSSSAGTAATAGQVMISALPIIVGTQLVLSFINFDVGATPRLPRNTRHRNISN
jgi:dolichol-phosphate mannosyltransferase